MFRCAVHHRLIVGEGMTIRFAVGMGYMWGPISIVWGSGRYDEERPLTAVIRRIDVETSIPSRLRRISNPVLGVLEREQSAEMKSALAHSVIEAWLNYTPLY
jgi:hypothetical protein